MEQALPGDTAGLSVCACAGEALHSCDVIPFWNLASTQFESPFQYEFQTARLLNAPSASLANRAAVATCIQFKATTIKTVAPTTAEGIQRYLGSGLVKGIGPILLLNNSTVKSLILAAPDYLGASAHQSPFSFPPDQRNPRIKR